MLVRICLCFILFLSSPCLAQNKAPDRFDRMVKTAVGVYQTLRTKIITAFGTPPGLFILVSERPIGLQSFDPEQIKPDEVASLFIEYNLEQDRYTALHVHDKIYKVRGNFTVSIEDVRIGVDNTNVYASVSQGGGLIGFRGLERVIDSMGPQSVIAEANEYSDHYNIAPYVLQDNKLLLRGNEVSTKTLIGLTLEQPKNDCLNQGVLFLPQDKIDAIKSTTNRQERVKLLQESLRDHSSRLFLSKTLMLRVKKEFIIALDYLDGVLFEVKPIQSKFANRPVCVVKKMSLA